MFGLDKDKKRQFQSLLAWLSTVAEERDMLLMDLPGYKGYFYFEFPLRYAALPRKIKGPLESKKATFIVRRPLAEPAGHSWIKIFSSPEIEVLENKNRAGRAAPLRWGLNDEEREKSFKIGRDSLKKFLEHRERLPREYFYGLPPKFFFKTGLDVALWVKGHLRGSAVVQGRHLGEGIAEAAILASRDARFKPLARDELAAARLEITVIQALRVPLSAKERRENFIYPEKGYLLEYKGREGWFLPEVLNVRRFRNLEEFLENLAREKAGLAPDACQKADIYIFEVDDFIESENRQEALTLSGPLVDRPHPPFDSNFITARLKMAADWLCHIQEPDGNLPPIVNPLASPGIKADLTRLAFTAWALAEFGKAVPENKYIRAAEKSFLYLKKYLVSGIQLQVQNLALAYFGQLALALEKFAEAAASASQVARRIDGLDFEPITFSQLAVFFKKMSASDRRFAALLEDAAQALKKNYRPANPVLWAELANVFGDSDPAFSQAISRWLTANWQVGYTRGVGKIFEVLALCPEKNRPTLEKILTWLLNMQYDMENTFFVPAETRPQIIGALRHDYFNSEAWIDAAGHLLLGGSRLLKKQN